MLEGPPTQHGSGALEKLCDVRNHAAFFVESSVNSFNGSTYLRTLTVVWYVTIPIPVLIKIQPTWDIMFILLQELYRPVP